MRPHLIPLALLCTAPVLAQDLYDPETLRTIDITFHDSNWWTLLAQNYQSQTMILADLTMEGVTYPDVGVRIRGNTSYTSLPAGSEKVSLAVDMDFVDPDQDLLGYNTLNLNNAHRDPTFCREVVYNNFVARYIPNGRSNHVLLTLNGQEWGVYVNVQQYNKDLLRDYFDDETGMRVKCANNPNGPGLRYVGASSSLYSGYEIKDDGGLADPWAALIAVCDAVTNTPAATWQQADATFAIDPSIWSVVLENLFTDDDSYVNKGADFTLYRDPVDGRAHLLQTDGNETWTSPTWAIDRNFTAANKPVLSHLLAVPELRARYMAHMRTALESFDWAQLGAELSAARDRIDAYVSSDPKKLYTYAQFLSNFTASVTLSGSGPGGGTVVGLQPFVVQRRALLANHAEITAPAPVIDWIHHEPTLPAPGDAVYVTADVAPGGVPVASVSLYYLATPGSYQQVSMLDDGLHADFAAGDGIYGALLPITASSGQEVKYYVAATSANTYGTVSFEPALTELAPATLQYSFGTSGLRITEYLYSGTDGEFVEFTNTTAAPIDLTGWSMDDQSALPGTLDLSAAGVLAPGASFLVTDADPVAFAAAWGLSGTVVIGPNADAALGRNDEINLFDASGDLVERLTYGDEDFPGSVRAKDASAQGCWQALGNNNPFGWSLSVVGDAHGSFASSGGDVGSPGVFALVTCSGLGNTLCDPAVANSTGGPATLTAFGSPYAETNRVVLVASALPPGEFGFFLNGTAAGFVANPGGSMGNLCLGGSLGRYNRASEIFAADATGQGSLALDLSNTPTPTGPTAVLAGQTWYYQCWYRDTSVTSSNFTGALEIVYQ